MEDGVTSFKVFCPKCKIGTNIKTTTKEAVTEWNDGHSFPVGINLLTKLDEWDKMPWYRKIMMEAK
jgi:hypothetical protein